tara:strand:- start:1556 stop:1912 length:357 start_codon:yes stop_codon:yes gene_type:complete
MNIKKNPVNESSISAYCFIMAIYCFMNFGLNQIFWIYFLLTVMLSGIYGYRIYSSDQENKTYTFFQFDHFSVGLLLISIYIDSNYKIINFQIDTLSNYFLFIGLILIVPTIIKFILNK